MQTTIWHKYVPIIKILMKRAASEDQTLELNKTDFEKSGLAKKAGNKFKISFQDGRIADLLHTNEAALELANVMMDNEAVSHLIQENNYEIGLTTKLVLTIKNTSTESVDA